MPRYTLKLNTLDFLSLVDEPAQQTAKIRLIKRAPGKGGKDEVQATITAKVAKIGAGENPLVYCWAFTCTDESGQPYYDLQDDAISADDFVKAAEAFMAAGGAVDEMHDGQPTAARVAFAYPMDSSIASAMLGAAAGAATKTSGLMVAIRPTAEQLAKLRSGEYTGVSIAGTGIRELVDKARRKKPKRPAMSMGSAAAGSAYKNIAKMTVLTSVEGGHQHGICLDDPEHPWTTILTTAYAMAEGDSEEHCHAWTYDQDGKITIATNAAHTHTVSELVPPDVIAAVALEEDRCAKCGECCSDCTYCPACGTRIAPMEGVAMRAPAGVSTPPKPAPTVSQQEKAAMELRKALATILALTEPQRAHFATLSPEGAEEFLGKSAPERDAIVKAAADADPVVHTTKSGLAIRKSAGPIALELAKQADAAAEQIAKQAEQIAKANAAREQVELEKRAATALSHFGKSTPVAAAILKAVDGIADEAVRKDAHEALKGANTALVELGKAAGHSGGEGPTDASDPRVVFKSELAVFAKSVNKTEGAATAEFIRTERGADLYAAAYPRTQA